MNESQVFWGVCDTQYSSEPWIPVAATQTQRKQHRILQFMQETKSYFLYDDVFGVYR